MSGVARRGRPGVRRVERPTGEIRRSQVVTTFGPGALVDLVDDAVLIGGLDFWAYQGVDGWQIITEPRLRDSIAQRFASTGRELSMEAAFREPPPGRDAEPTRMSGIRVLEFPQWFVCQNPKCRRLIRSDLLEHKGRNYWHQCSRTRREVCVPVRFVVACPRGHLDEFPWIAFAHMKHAARCPSPELRLWEGATGDFSEIQVACTSCESSENLSTFLSPALKWPCPGERPWLGPEGREACESNVRLLVRTASNAYFSQVVSALSIPESGRELEDAVQGNWDVLKAATRETLPVFRTIEKISAAIGSFADEDVLAAVDAIAHGERTEREPIRTAEHRLFMAAPPESPGELPRSNEVFHARRAQPEGGLPAGLERLVLARKLREVRAQIGFTRIEPVTPDLQGEYDLNVQSAPLGLTTNWLPATEIYGEGVFIELDHGRIAEWEARDAVVARAEELEAGYADWTQRLAEGSSVARDGSSSSSKQVPATARPAQPPPFPTIRFYLLHSLAHLLISAISLECGYAASAIRERIYCSATDDAPMAGILLSTGSAGSEGTLGGLVDQGRRITEHLRHAWDLGSLCANDPVCSSHSPRDDRTDRHLEGAACHGCLFIAECSCERFNRYLDRALVVPSIGHPASLAFFTERP